MHINHSEFVGNWSRYSRYTTETYTRKRQSIRQKTRKSFLISLIIHAIALGVVSFGYIRWYQPVPPSEPLVSEAIAVTNIPRFHVTSPRKRAMPAAKRSTPTLPTVATGTDAPMRPTPASSSSRMLMPGTDARLPMAETSLSEQTTKTPEWKSLGTAPAQVPTLQRNPVHRHGQQRTTVTAEPTHAAPIDRDAEMGEALEGIAESIADGDSEPVNVDIVFLLDISGSMIDNIRAVGRQLNQMVEVFEQKNVDFTLGIVIFRYLEDDTIIHPQTRDVERYKRLLTSHVVAAAGDERAHNAIIKTIRRVNFREDANRRFVLVTDEASKGSYSLSEVLVQCLQQKITVDVIGINHTTHKALTVKTGGLWFPIPKQQ